MILTLVTVVILLFATIEDIRKMEVKNVYPLLILFLSIMRAVFEEPPLYFLILNTLLAFAVLYAFWHFKGLGGADVKILTALAIGEGIGIWVIILFSCVIFILYALVLRKPRQALPFVPAIFIGAILELFLGGYFG